MWVRVRVRVWVRVRVRVRDRLGLGVGLGLGLVYIEGRLYGGYRCGEVRIRMCMCICMSRPPRHPLVTTTTMANT